MAQFVVLEPAGSIYSAKAEKGLSERIAPQNSDALHTDALHRAEKTVFIKDGFSVLALILPVVWLLINRLWFEAFCVLALIILLGFAGTLLGNANAGPLLSLLLSLFVALEGSNWKIMKLRRKGYHESATIDAPNLDEAEIRYFTLFQPQAEHKPAPDWTSETSKPNLTQNATINPTASTIGFVGYRGEI
ncbi:DUF2628 domain-containing protein [Falsochrobactrum ovis]|uniref:Uncharacterized protein DUF2628 n=1 Tax=Falsochrobactrum ovis TaxID=1293442 RepID=A0A364JZ35_9HYPH|nr:uncharacterized protein DUF2628 [Falsochrobactrum ovis]